MSRTLLFASLLAVSTATASFADAQSVSPAAPPPGLLSPIEQMRHQQFLKRAQAGDIDLLFLGSSQVEFWLHDWAGRTVWDANYASRKAASFGAQGASSEGILWRVRNGELDGFKAKAIVVAGPFANDVSSDPAVLCEGLASSASLVAELRKRQPQAKILLVMIPRGLGNGRASSIAEDAQAKQFASLVDGTTVQFLDLRETFAGADGIMEERFRSGRGNALNAAGYAEWASAMNPKLAELLR